MTLLTTRRPRPRANTAPVIRTLSVPSPVRGLNSRDPVAGMKPTDALILDNVLCRPGYVEVRAGWQPHATGLVGGVETLFPYSSVTGEEELYAAANGGIFDVTLPGAVGAGVVTGMTSNYWEQTQFSNQAGNFLILANGVNNAKIYDGSTWGNLGVTGLAITSIIDVAVWKRRLWLVEKDSMSAWYAATDAIAGAVTEFPFSGIFRRGGYLQAILNWTVDGGDGVDDYLVALTSEGEIALYRGTDPASASTFSLVGVFYVGAPVGFRCHAQYGGELILLTQQGLVFLSEYLDFGATVDRLSPTNRLQELLRSEINVYGGVVGWELHVYFEQGFLFINVPADSPYQYCMSTITRSWSRLLHGTATTWTVQGTTLWQGQATAVVNSWTGGLDNTEAIAWTVLPAFTDFKAPTVQKHFTLGRTTIQADSAPAIAFTMLVDYNTEISPASLSTPVLIGSLWDSAVWDTAIWGLGLEIRRDWVSLNNLGYAGAVLLQGLSRGEVIRLLAQDYVYQPGGLL